MSKMMVKRDGLWIPMEGLKGDTGPLPADNSVTNDALVMDGAKTNTAYLMGNRLTKDAEGELISVDDSYAVPLVSLSVDGKSTQVTTTGKNLFDVSSANTGGYFDASTGEYITHSASKWVSIPLTGNASICRVKGLPNGRTTWWNDGVFIGGSGAGSGNPIDIPEGCDELRSSWFGTLSNPIITIDQPIDPYEPYTGGKPSPSPDYPQEIVSLEQVGLQFAGKNLLPTLAEATTVNGVTFAPNADGSVTVTGTATEDATVLLTTDGRIDNTGTLFADPLTLSGAPDGSTSTYALQIRYYSVPVGGTRQHTAYATTSATLNRSGTTWYWADILLFVKSGATVNATMRPQLELGSTATEYQPYVGTTAPLYDGTLRSLPDGTKDELYLKYLRPSSREGWAWYTPTLTQRIAKVEIRSFSTIGTNSSRYCVGMTNIGGRYVSAYNAAGDPLRGASNRFKTQQSSGNYVNDGHFVYYSGNGYITFAFANGRFANVAEANAWLAENPTYVHLKLKTPTTTTLDPIELPIMQAGTTNIWTDPSTNLSVTYERDRNIVISNLEAAAADLATS